MSLAELLKDTILLPEGIAIARQRISEMEPYLIQDTNLVAALQFLTFVSAEYNLVDEGSIT